MRVHLLQKAVIIPITAGVRCCHNLCFICVYLQPIGVNPGEVLGWGFVGGRRVVVGGRGRVSDKKKEKRRFSKEKRKIS